MMGVATMPVNPQFGPLQINPKTGEPFLQLPSPLDHIIITPLRLTDKPTIIEILNDDRVHLWLAGPPYPFLQEHADWWVDMHQALCDKVIRELEDEYKTNPDGSLEIVEVCPIRSIREVKADGTDVYLGDLGFRRYDYAELSTATEEERQKKKTLIDINMAKKTGDPSIVWSVGDYLAASHHRRGIMTAAIAALLDAWIIPRCNVHVIRACIFAGNHGSVRVFEKNGFKLQVSSGIRTEVKGNMRELNIVEWRLEDQQKGP